MGDYTHKKNTLLIELTDKANRLWGLKQGAKDYLTKPVSEKALMTTVNSLLG